MNATVHTIASTVTSATLVRNAPAARKVCFEVPVTQALSFRAHEPSVLRVTQGRVWVTRDSDARQASEDLVLGEGASLRLARGERVVFESWSAGQPAASWFSWEPVGR